ncbi:alpha/beta fold hydrolase [Tropicibacter sp. R15_0]|uniref:esterase/lipase family protein n=1 Tax=Tropicibacter sp. R15_0 TaxID=2821101 RepID=UPI00336AE2E6
MLISSAMKNVLTYVFLVLTCLAAPARADCVVMLHGLARTGNSFLVLERVLQTRGYEVVVADYPSTEAPIEQLVKVIPEAIGQCHAPAVHFVTHSMGGILLRYWTEHNTALGISRVVMLAPPNQGSEIVDELGDLAPFEWINGPAGLQLRTGDEGITSTLGPVQFELGVIAGSDTMNPAFSAILPGVDDGKVTVASTIVEGMKAHLTLPVTHTFIMQDPMAMAQVDLFLREGRFDPDLDWTQEVDMHFFGCLAGICPAKKDETPDEP